MVSRPAKNRSRNHTEIPLRAKTNWIGRGFGGGPQKCLEGRFASALVITLLLVVSSVTLAYWAVGILGAIATLAIVSLSTFAHTTVLTRRVDSLWQRLAQLSSVSNEEPLCDVGGHITSIGCSLGRGIAAIARQKDPLYRELALLQLSAIDRQMTEMADGRIVFVDTESWRTAYERILCTEGLKHYLSAAWLRSEDYWRDAAGRHSIRLNYDLIQLGLRIERTLILNDFFWPEGALLPAKVICRWIEDQYKHGLVIRLVRESEISDETDLLCDFGIYGDRATGTLVLDDQCRSLRYTLDFDSRSLKLAEDRWRRLVLFSHSFRELLDRAIRGG